MSSQQAKHETAPGNVMNENNSTKVLGSLVQRLKTGAIVQDTVSNLIMAIHQHAITYPEQEWQKKISDQLDQSIKLLETAKKDINSSGFQYKP